MGLQGWVLGTLVILVTFHQATLTMYSLLLTRNTLTPLVSPHTLCSLPVVSTNTDMTR